MGGEYRDQKQKSPPRPEPGGQEGSGAALRVDPVGALALSDLKDSTVYPAFFIAPAMNPRTVCFCQPICSMISASVAPFFALEHRHHLRRLAALARTSALASPASAAFLALGAFFARAGLLGRGRLRGRALWLLCASVGYGSAGSAASGAVSATGSISAWSVASSRGSTPFPRLRAPARLPATRRVRLPAPGASNGVSGSRRCGLFSEALNRLPDALGRRPSVGELGDRLYASKAVPDLDQPLVVGPDQVGELFFGRKYARASFASCLAGGVNGDVVVGVDGECFHVSALFPVAYSRMDIDHSGRGHKQAESAGNRKK